MSDTQPQPKSFADYKTEGHLWITLAKGAYYPDYLADASKLYAPYLEIFGQLVAPHPPLNSFFER